jgi:hypothetical protein
MAIFFKISKSPLLDSPARFFGCQVAKIRQTKKTLSVTLQLLNFIMEGVFFSHSSFHSNVILLF